MSLGELGSEASEGNNSRLNTHLPRPAFFRPHLAWSSTRYHHAVRVGHEHPLGLGRRRRRRRHTSHCDRCRASCCHRGLRCRKALLLWCATSIALNCCRYGAQCACALWRRVRPPLSDQTWRVVCGGRTRNNNARVAWGVSKRPYSPVSTTMECRRRTTCCFPGGAPTSYSASYLLSGGQGKASHLPGARSGQARRLELTSAVPLAPATLGPRG